MTLYSSYIHQLTDTDLATETRQAVREQNAERMQSCINEWNARGNPDGFLKCYNEVVKTSNNNPAR